MSFAESASAKRTAFSIPTFEKKTKRNLMKRMNNETDKWAAKVEAMKNRENEKTENYVFKFSGTNSIFIALFQNCFRFQKVT